jgi:PHD/YefM family antitoxin component YafN of YafNO toxin-antitoxin module
MQTGPAAAERTLSPATDINNRTTFEVGASLDGMSTVTFPFSTLINKQTSVFPALADSDVILERRDAENLVLIRSERFEAMAISLRLTARSLAVIAKTNHQLAEEVFAEELPWLKWLPADARTECVKELLENLLAGVDTGLFLPFAREFYSWRSTAEAYSDPELMRDLTKAHTTTGPDPDDDE